MALVRVFRNILRKNLIGQLKRHYHSVRPNVTKY